MLSRGSVRENLLPFCLLTSCPFLLPTPRPIKTSSTMARPSSPVPSITFDEKKLEAGSTEHHEDVVPREFVAADETCFESCSEEQTKAMEKRFVRKVGLLLFEPGLSSY